MLGPLGLAHECLLLSPPLFSFTLSGYRGREAFPSSLTSCFSWFSFFNEGFVNSFSGELTLALLTLA